MPAAYVRDTGTKSTSDVGSDSASFASLPAAGNGVFVFVSVYNEAGAFAPGDVTDNQGVGNSYGTLLTLSQPNAQAGLYGDGDIGATSGTFTITVNPVGSTGIYMEWIAVEFSGLAAPGADQFNTSTTTGTTPTVTSPTTTYADELVMGLYTATSAAASGIDPAAGYTTLHLHDLGTDTVVHYSAYKIVSSIGTQNFNAGTLGTSAAHTIGIQTWRGTSGAAADNVYQIQPGVILQAMNRGATF